MSKKRTAAATTTAATTPIDSPRGGLLTAAALYAVVTLILAYPALTGGFLVSQTSDQYIGGYAVRTFGAALWHATGHLPQWNPYIFGGMPFIGSVNGDTFYPPAIFLRIIARPDVAVTWLFIVHEFLAGLFTYVFLRALGMSFIGALVGGLAYMMGGPIASYVSPGHDGKLYVSALFPLMGWTLVRGLRDGYAWAWPTLALITGLGILTPHPQLMQYSLLGAGAIGLYLAFWAPETRATPQPVMIRRLALALGAVTLGLLMGAIQFAPVLEYIKYSPRAGGGQAGAGGYAWSGSYSMPPEELFGAYLPEFFGILDRYWGRTGIHYQSDYIGAAVLMLSGASFFSRRRAERLFWITVGVVSLLWTLGSYTPFFHLVYALVPGTKFFRAPSTIFFLTAFAIAALAGQGAEAAIEGRIRPAYLIACAAFAGLIALLAGGGGLTNAAAALAVPDAYGDVLSNASAVTFGAVRALIAVLGVATIVVLMVRGKLTATAGGWALAAVIALDLWSEERQYWKWSPPASITYASNPAIDSALAQREPGRVLTLPTNRTVPGDVELEYDGLMIHRVRQVTGYHSDELHRYDVLIDKNDHARRAFTPQIWALLNVRFLYTDLDSLPMPGARRIVGPVRDVAGSMVSLYRLPGDNPAAWVVPLAIKATDDQTLATILDSRFPPRVAALFDTAARVPVTSPAPPTLPPPLDLTANVTRYEPEHITVALSAPAPAGSTLVVSENDYPGWSATVDGHPAVAARVDYTLIGVPLPAGAHSIDLTYEDPLATTGVTITGITLAAALAWLALTFRGRRATR
jgi:Bacterial membrane protein YfhO